MYRIFTFWVLFTVSLQAQDMEKTTLHKTSGTELSSSLTYAGLSSALLYNFSIQKHRIYGGPRLLLSDSYLPFRGPFGGRIGYQYIVLQNERWRSGAGIDYQFVLSRPFRSDDGLQSIHEYHVSYGFSFRLLKRWWINTDLGAGFYLEELGTKSNRQSFTGFSNLINLSVRYEW